MSSIFGSVHKKSHELWSAKGNMTEVFKTDAMTLGRDYNYKFFNERFIYEDEKVVVVFEGFLFDIKNYSTQKEFVLSEITLCGFHDFIKSCDGSFSICVFDRIQNKIHLGVDHLASQKIFYHNSEEFGFVFSSDLFDVTRGVKLENKLTLNIDNIYYFLGFGSMINERTFFNDIYQLESGNYLTYNIGQGSVNKVKYREHKFDINENLTEEEVVKEYDDIIKQAMSRIIALNDFYDYRPLAGLSGGLDSKSMAILMHQMTNKIMTTFTFSESGSLDHKIAEEVSSALKMEHIFISLDNGYCLVNNFEEAIRRTNGQVSIHSLLHTLNSTKKIAPNNYGLLLTGQIGDVIFGSHDIGSKKLKEYVCSKSLVGEVPEYIYNKIGFIDSVIASYTKENCEGFVYDGRQSNGTLYGDIVNRYRFDTITPFFSKKLLEFTLSVPRELRQQEHIYLKWLKYSVPQTLDFKWDKCNCRPSNLLKIKVFKYLNRVNVGIRKRLGLKYTGMNPFDIWFRKNPTIEINLDRQFEDNLYVLNEYPDLNKDVKKYFHNELERYKRNKFVVVSLLLSLKMHIEG
ncbi:hypothetical protein GCM10007916_06890 [Psychromonas marina]|uniref:asparagine synthase (glutamine-hydrolyzing) n=1 Tax=Psychromonas marina TaxID=88364 RepID=A0ABQ6DX31_9GAMM|nr:asparagine synthase-related protein [Psychromonas marina]GLS89622.1 hypothetical protein GCM10007916_06890 [Psychromonas marina]